MTALYTISVEKHFNGKKFATLTRTGTKNTIASFLREVGYFDMQAEGVTVLIAYYGEA